jgi:hypothetical protein
MTASRCVSDARTTPREDPIAETALGLDEEDSIVLRHRAVPGTRGHTHLGGWATAVRVIASVHLAARVGL